MSYVLQAILGDAADLKICSAIGGPLIDLPQEKALIPLTERVRAAHEIPLCPLTGENEDECELPSAIELLVASAKKKIAYVEAEFFGGDGTQAAAVWEEGSLIFGPVVANNAINQALRLLGVSKHEHLDEFAALSLGRHRDTEEWK